MARRLNKSEKFYFPLHSSMQASKAARESPLDS